MIRVVLDTNTLVSAAGWGGTPGQLLDLALADDPQLALITSPPLLDEFSRVLRYPKLAGIFDDPDRWVHLLETIAEVVYPAITLTVVADEPDNRVLEAAVTAEADAIVTGDRALRAINSCHQIPVRTPDEFLADLRP